MKLFEPGKIGQLTLKNRIIMAPMGTRLSNFNGEVTNQTIAYYVTRAKGGVGMIITSACAVDRQLGGRSHLIIMDNDVYIADHNRLVEAVHDYGAKISLQLFHPGRHSTLEETQGQQPVAPSAVPETISGLAAGGLKPRELTVAEIKQLVEEFAAAAVRARRAGYDAVEIHGAHGYLIHQFFSPRSNQRSDRYGGSLENRARFATEIVKRVKERVGESFPVIFRLTAEETVDANGYTFNDAKYYAGQLEAAGIDALHLTMGTMEDSEGISRNCCPTVYPQGWRLPYSEAMKKVIKIPLITVGAIREPLFAEKILQDGKADFIALGRQLIADPGWPDKAARGHFDSITLCPSCNYCMHRLGQGLSMHCAINPEAGRETEAGEFRPPVKLKRVMVAGSGPAGMKAAITAASRGHDVTLYEKGGELGAGQLKLVSAAPGKERMKYFKDSLVKQVKDVKIDVRLGTEVSPDLVDKVKPDVLVVATGARPLIPQIPGVDLPHVGTAHDVLSGKVEITGQRVVVIGSFATGCEVAEFLADRMNKVTIVARSPRRDLARGAYAANRFALISRLSKNKNVNIINEVNVERILPDRVVIASKKGEKQEIPADKVVLSRGVVPVNELAEVAKGKVEELFVIGDAREPRNIAEAIHEGKLVGNQI